ncbi:MAG: hypothetical protein ACOX9B_14485 [Candidatus Xenobium sp.]
MNLSIYRHGTWEFVGKISVDDETGRLVFLSGNPELREFVQQNRGGFESVRDSQVGDRIYSGIVRVTLPTETMFESLANTVLLKDGFLTEKFATYLKGREASSPQVMS